MMNSCDAAAIVSTRKRARTHLRGSSPGWVMLDCRVRRMSEDDYSGATVAENLTSTGDRITVAFKPSAPPGISRLLFDWHPRQQQQQQQEEEADSDSIDDDQGTKSDMDDLRVYQDTEVMAAHRDSILLCLLVPNPATSNLLLPFSVSFREEHFVYQPARAVPLTALGPCGHDIVNNDGRSNIGILCRGDRDFVVAHLIVNPLEDDDDLTACPVTAQLCRYCHDSGSGSGSWGTRWLPIRHGQDEGRDLLWWETDFVVPCGDFIRWVDYLRGILLCDVFSPVPELHYVRLPINPHQSYADHDYGLHSYRSVCVTKDGVIKFVDAASSRFWFSGSLHHPSASPFTITSWTLSSDRLTWVKDATLDAEDFFSLASNARLPSIIPEFPLMDMDDPNIIYFTLTEERGCNGKAFLVAVNISRKTLELKTSYTLTSTFLRGEYGDDSDTTSCNLFCNEPFLPCEFSNYLNLNLGVTDARIGDDDNIESSSEAELTRKDM